MLTLKGQHYCQGFCIQMRAVETVKKPCAPLLHAHAESMSHIYNLIHHIACASLHALTRLYSDIGVTQRTRSGLYPQIFPCISECLPAAEETLTYAAVAVEQSLEVEGVYAEELAKWIKAVKGQGHRWEFYAQPCYQPSKNPKVPQK